MTIEWYGMQLMYTYVYICIDWMESSAHELLINKFRCDRVCKQ